VETRAEAKCNVVARSNIGRFISEMEMAGQQTTEEMVRQGAAAAKRNAPVGSRPDRRSIPIRESIYWVMRGRTQGSFGASARHAIFQEKGTRPHTMVGNPTFHFFWENMGRWWVPGAYGEIDYINHPGNPAQPFLEPALLSVMARWRRIAARYYKG
jgi:HK97 gp10 family phage protein